MYIKEFLNIIMLEGKLLKKTSLLISVLTNTPFLIQTLLLEALYEDYLLYCYTSIY